MRIGMIVTLCVVSVIVTIATYAVVFYVSVHFIKKFW